MKKKQKRKIRYRDFTRHANFFRHKCEKASHDLDLTQKDHADIMNRICTEFEPIASKRFSFNRHYFYFESNADLLTFKLQNNL